MNNKPQKTPVFNSDQELGNFLLENLSDSLRQSIRVTVKIMIKQEMENLRKEIDKKLSFNGCYERNMISGVGKINNIEVPRFREQRMHELPLKSMNIFNNEKEKFLQLVGEMHRLGVSQRKVGKICEVCFGVKVSKNQTGLVHQELAKKESLQINSQRLADEFDYLLVDGLWVKCKSWGLKDSDKSVLLCALGIKPDGSRKVIGFQVSDKEDYENWISILENLKQRGLAGKNLKLIIADDNGALIKAVSHLFPQIPIQNCIVHKMRNVIGKTRHKNKPLIAEDLRKIYQSQSKDEAMGNMKATARKWYLAEPRAIESLRFDFERTLTYFQFSKELWSKIRTTNILEREFREVRRRIKVFDSSFENEQSLMNYGNTIFDYLNHHYPARLIHRES